jgi:hypothetical protein
MPGVMQARWGAARRQRPTAPTGVDRLPNLLVIGAQKAGTTWLHSRLAAHPEVQMSRKKELNFFADRNYCARLNEYRAQFPTQAGKRFYGESTPGYFWTHDPASPWCAAYSLGNRDIAGSVFRTLGAETRLIVSLRHPVERAISAFYHHFRRGRLGADARLGKLGATLGIVDIGLYTRHHAAWEAVFGVGSLVTVLFDSIVAEPDGVLRRIYSALELNCPDTLPEPRAEHVGFQLRLRDDIIELDPQTTANSALLGRWGRAAEEAPKVHAEDIAALLQIYRDEIAACQRLFCEQDGVDWTSRTRIEDFLLENR